MNTLAILLLPLASLLSTPPEHSRPAPAVLRATGVGKPPPGKSGAQARLMARRAAEVVALRNLAARLQGQPPTGSTGTYVAATDGFIRGYHFLPARTLPDGRVEVTVELPLERIRTNRADLARALTWLEAELHAASVRLQRAHAQARRTRARLTARLASLEQQLSELRSLLAELSAPPTRPASRPEPATEPHSD